MTKLAGKNIWLKMNVHDDENYLAKDFKKMFNEAKQKTISELIEVLAGVQKMDYDTFMKNLGKGLYND